MLIKQDGNLRTWHYTILYTHIHALYILHICTCTFMLDVSKRGALDRRMTILHFFLHILMFFIDYVFWADHEHVFWRMPAYSTYS